MRAKVTILAFESSVEMSITIVRDLFVAAELAQQRQRTREAVATGQTVTTGEAVAIGDAVEIGEARATGGIVVATPNGSAVRTFSGSKLIPDLAIDDVDHADLIIVSGVWGDKDRFLDENQKTAEWLRSRHEQGSVIACMHTGALLLARAGLLDGKPATVYWRLENYFRARFPKVILQPERKITAAADVYCSSGIASGLELGIFLIERFYGIGIAEKISRNFLMDVERPSGEFLLAFDSYKDHSDDKVLTAQQWMESNCSSDFLLEELAHKVGMGLRSFMRRFQKATGETALTYLQCVRIETSKEFLRSGSLSIDEIAFRVGYRDATHFGRLFKRFTNQTPSEFREQFASRK